MLKDCFNTCVKPWIFPATGGLLATFAGAVTASQSGSAKAIAVTALVGALWARLGQSISK